MILLKCLLIGLLFSTGVVMAQAPVIVEPPVELKTAHQPCLVIKECIEYYGEIYHLSKSKIELMKKVIYCESGNNHLAVGDNNTSFGLSQIHLPAWKNITKEQAFSIDFSINFMAKQFSKGNEGIWSCVSIVKNIH